MIHHQDTYESKYLDQYLMNIFHMKASCEFPPLPLFYHFACKKECPISCIPTNCLLFIFIIFIFLDVMHAMCITIFSLIKAPQICQSKFYIKIL